MSSSQLAIVAAVLLASALVAWQAYVWGARRAQRAAAELTTLNDIGRELLRAQLNVDDLCELVYEQARQIVPTSFFQVGLFDGTAYDVKVWVLDDERQSPRVYPQGGASGIVGWVRDSGQLLQVADFEVERSDLPAFPEHEIEEPPRSAVFVPLIAGDATIGVIAIQSREPRRFTEEHVRLLTALANQAASAIRNAQLYERARHRAEQLNLIGEVTAQVSSVQPLPSFFSQIVSLIKEKFGYYSVSIIVVNEAGDLLNVGASTSDAFKDVDAIVPGQGMIGWAAQQGKTALANNVAHDTRYRKLGVLPETQSEIALPLKAEGRVLGVLDVQSDRLDAFGSEDVLLLETLASQIALAIDQAQVYAEERALAQRLEALIQVSQAIVSVLDLDDLLDRLVELIAETFEFERVHIFVRIGNLLVFRAGTGAHSVRWLIEELSYTLEDEGLIPRAARTGQAARVADVRVSEDYVPGTGLEDTRSEMVVPIQMAGRVMGVLDLQSEAVGAFSDDDLVLMQSLADSVAVALRNAALYANERRRRNLADALREVSASLAAELDLDNVLAEILEGLRRVLTLDTAAILLIEENADALTVYATTGAGLEGYVGHRMPLDQIDVHDDDQIDRTIRRIYHDLLGNSEESPLVWVPLGVGGTVIGFLVADQPLGWLHSGDDYEIVSAFANQAAIAISNGRLYAAQQAEAYVTTALLQVAEAVNAQAEVDEALETVARLTALLAGVSRCLILSWDSVNNVYRLNAQYGVSRERFAAAAAVDIPAEDYPLLDLLSVADRPIGAGGENELAVPMPLARLLPSSPILCFPLKAKRGPVGLLVVDDPRGGGSNSRLMHILTGIAHQTATMLETAALQASAVERERLEQELEVARNIQASFMPDAPPQVPGWEVAPYWQSARQVSGDFYDFIPLPDGKWGLVIADVADKGTPAALFMAVCRTLLRAVAISRSSPAATLERVNELLFNDARSDLFVTVFYAIWDPPSGKVSFASGGHNPPLVMRAANGKIDELHCKGIALGVIKDIDLHEASISLLPGDVLAAYTDGVTEAMQEDYTEWGMERFQETLLAQQGEGAHEMLAGTLTAINQFVGGAAQSDDLTLWFLKRQATV